MDPVFYSPSRTPRFIWDRKFSHRQHKKYSSEDVKLEREAGQRLTDIFLKAQMSGLDPPQYVCPELEAFLLSVPDPQQGAQPSSTQIQDFKALVDDRRDDTGWHSAKQRHSARDWDGYAAYPPEGVDVRFELLNDATLKTRMLEAVGQSARSIAIVAHHNKMLERSNRSREAYNVRARVSRSADQFIFRLR